MSGGYYFSVRVLRDLVLEYMAWVFDNSIPVRQPPAELIEKVWRCKIGNRSKPYPPSTDGAAATT